MYAYQGYSTQQEVDPANVKINRTLPSLNVVEVYYLLQRLFIEIPFEVLQRHQINGEILSLIVNPWELNEMGIQIPVVKARLLLKRIETFKVEGVPNSLIVPLVQAPVAPPASATIMTSSAPMATAPRITYPMSNVELFQGAKMWADQGNVDGQYSLGLCYEQGKGVAVDKDKAFRYFKLAADRGHAQALCSVGLCYYSGIGVRKNRQDAFRYYRLSADQGYAGGMYNAAMCYSLGKGIAMNKEEAFLYFELAAALGHMQALTSLGHCYDRGEGTVQDKAEAYRCYKEAADSASPVPMAQYCVGVYLSSGEGGVLVDRQAAFTYWKAAADVGRLAIAMRSVADCYARGDGVSRDKKEARRYYKLAAATATATGDNSNGIAVEGCGVGCPIS